MRVVVSLTTIPGREQLVERAIRSARAQSHPPDKIYLWLPEGRELGRLSLADTPRLQVKKCRDQGPATKLLPTLDEERDPATLIITIDDDVEYPETLVHKLVQASTLFPESAIGFTGWQVIRSEPKPVIAHFNEELSACRIFQPVHVIEGTRGTLYRRGFFDETIKVHIEALEAFRYHDDIFFAGYLSSHGIPRIVRWFADGLGAAHEHWKIDCQEEGLHTTPNWYGLGEQCWAYWANYFAREDLGPLLQRDDRLQLNAAGKGREGFMHHRTSVELVRHTGDCVADLACFPWPWHDGRFREVVAAAGVPADSGFVPWLAECVRITEKGGIVKLDLDRAEAVSALPIRQHNWSLPAQARSVGSVTIGATVKRSLHLPGRPRAMDVGENSRLLDQCLNNLRYAVEHNGNRISLLLLRDELESLKQSVRTRPVG